MKNKATVLTALIALVLMTLVAVHQNSTIQQQRVELRAAALHQCK